jgi:hypothetical protein
MSEDYTLWHVDPEKLDEYWPQILPYLKNAINYANGRYGIDDIYSNIKSSLMALWIAYNNDGIHAACVTQIIRYPQKKCLAVLFCGGKNVNGWVHFLKTIIEDSKQYQCESVEIWGRPGWQKLLGAMGFKKTHIILNAELS